MLNLECVEQKKKSTKLTPGVWGATAWYQNLSIRIPRELGFRCL